MQSDLGKIPVKEIRELGLMFKKHVDVTQKRQASGKDLKQLRRDVLVSSRLLGMSAMSDASYSGMFGNLRYQRHIMGSEE